MRLNQSAINCLLAAAAARKLEHRSWILDAMTVSDKYTIEVDTDTKVKLASYCELEALKYPGITIGDVVRINKSFTGICETIENDLLRIYILADATHPCFDVLDVMDVNLTDAQKYFGNCPLTTTYWNDTTVGRFLSNIICLQYPMNFQKFKFVNKQWNPTKIMLMVKDEMLAKRVTVEEYEKFFDYLYFLGHITEIATPSMTPMSLMTNPKVAEFKKKFIEEHKDQMHDPLVIQQLESELIKLDKEYLGDDKSRVFFDGLGGSSYSVKRKKLFLTVGGIPGFGTEGGAMDFIPNALTEGWTKEALPSIANEIRKGSYERGVETAKGGAETKLVMRAFQDATISEDDCGTKRTIKIDCSQFNGEQFIGRTIRVGSVDVIVTEENLDKYVTGKVIQLYSPLTCETKNDFCYKCCGLKAKELGAKQLGIQSIKLTSKFMNISMQNMHGTALEVRENKLEDILL